LPKRWKLRSAFFDAASSRPPVCTQRALWLQRALCGLRWQGAAIGGRTAHMPHILRWRGVLLAGRRYLHFLGPARGNNQVACCAPREVSRFIYGVRERSRRPHTRSALPLTTVCDVKLEVTPERAFSLNKISARILDSCCGLCAQGRHKGNHAKARTLGYNDFFL